MEVYSVTYATVTDSQKKPISYTYLYQLVTSSNNHIYNSIHPIISPTRHSKLLNRLYFCGGFVLIYSSLWQHTVRTSRTSASRTRHFCSFVSIHAFLWSRTGVLTSRCFSILNPKVTYFKRSNQFFMSWHHYVYV